MFSVSLPAVRGTRSPALIYQLQLSNPLIQSFERYSAPVPSQAPSLDSIPEPSSFKPSHPYTGPNALCSPVCEYENCITAPSHITRTLKTLSSQGAAQPPSLEESEAEFWRLVEEGTQPVEVLAGVDLETSVVGSGFPRHPSAAGAHPGNLTTLLLARGKDNSAAWAADSSDT